MAMVAATQVQANLGFALTPEQSAQAELWIGWVERRIAERIGPLAGIDPEVLTEVVVEVVSARLRHPDPVRQMTVSVADGSVSRTYESSSGRLDITDDMWRRLGWVDPLARSAFSISPAYQPDSRRAW